LKKGPVTHEQKRSFARKYALRRAAKARSFFLYFFSYFLSASVTFSTMAAEAGSGDGTPAPKTLLRALSETSMRLLTVQMALPRGYKLLERKLRAIVLKPPGPRAERPDPRKLLGKLVKWASGSAPLESACHALADLLTGTPAASRRAVVLGDVNLVSLWLESHLGRPVADEASHWARFEEGVCLLVLAAGCAEAALDAHLTDAYSLAAARGAKEAERILVMCGACPGDLPPARIKAPLITRELVNAVLTDGDLTPLLRHADCSVVPVP
jgi:hypothetical protein